MKQDSPGQNSGNSLVRRIVGALPAPVRNLISPPATGELATLTASSAADQAGVHRGGSGLARKQGNRHTLDQPLDAATEIINLALNGAMLPGARANLAPGTLYGEASYASKKAFWQEVLKRDMVDIAKEYQRGVPVPEDVSMNYLARSFDSHTRIYLSVVAKTDPTVIERAIRALPRFTHFRGATGNPEEHKQLDVGREIDALNKIFSSPIPAIDRRQVMSIETDTYGVLEVTRLQDFEGSGEIRYSIGKDGVSYSISKKHGLGDLTGLFPELSVLDPRSLNYPSYTQLSQAIKNEGCNPRYDLLETQVATLPEFPASGPQGFKYCSHEAQQSLETGLPGNHQARINAVHESWNTQLRLDVYTAAARSPDLEVRILGTRLLAIYRQALPLLKEAVHDSSPEVRRIASKAIANHSRRLILTHKAQVLEA